MKTVFFNNCPIFLVTDERHKIEQHFYSIHDVLLLTIIKKIEQGIIKKVYFYDSDSNILWRHFSNHFKSIEAAGGKVLNEKNQVLFIYRNDKWDLPKGKIENNESIEEAAIREVEEETGVINLKIDKSLETTYHIYKYNDRYILKISYWFKMKSNFHGKLLPQLEEGITKVNWLSEFEINMALKDTYENIKRLF